MILVILEESNPSGQDQFKSVFSVCVLINVCRDDKSDNDDLFSFTCPVDNVKLDCNIVSICPLTNSLIVFLIHESNFTILPLCLHLFIGHLPRQSNREKDSVIDHSVSKWFL